MFRDEAVVSVRAGRGGDGCVSFRHEAFAPKGGPDGGDGGRGGSVVFEASRHESSLMDLSRMNLVKAEAGAPGKGANRYGHYGAEKRVLVPVGTMILDAETGELLADLTAEGNHWTAARGGRGGRGNKAFATATNQTPREFEYGEDGQARELRLELKLIADVGIAGLPNAGKSTLLGRVSAAKPKVAAYPFTTLVPKLGIVERGSRFIMADIPGLIEGASEGKGLGHQFLRHVERCRVIIHMVDLSACEVEELVAAYRTIRHELEAHSETLGHKRELIVGSKLDVTEGRERLPLFAEALGKEVLGISAVTGEGVDRLLDRVQKMLREADAEAAAAAAAQAAKDAAGASAADTAK
jgi:GTP-binding protein